MLVFYFMTYYFYCTNFILLFRNEPIVKHLLNNIYVLTFILAFWVTLVEVICYILQIASSSYRFEMADGAMLNVISPMAWCLACPVAMSFMMRIAWPEVSNRVTIALIMNLEAVM